MSKNLTKMFILLFLFNFIAPNAFITSSSICMISWVLTVTGVNYDWKCKIYK